MESDRSFLRAACLWSMAALLALAAAPGAAEVIYDSQGFEGFAEDVLHGQDGWEAWAVGSDGAIEPEVIYLDADDNQVVLLAVGDYEYDASHMVRVLPELIGVYEQVTVSFDILRFTPLPDTPDQQNLWWLWDSPASGGADPTPVYGLQWDIDGATYPFYQYTGNRPTVSDSFANVTMTWDFTTQLAACWYDGALVGENQAIVDISSLIGWKIWLAHDAATPGDPSDDCDYAFIDNFIVTGEPVPEPASLTLLAAVGGPLLLRRRRRG